MKKPEKLLKKRTSKVGFKPGSLVYTGENDEKNFTFVDFDFSADKLEIETTTLKIELPKEGKNKLYIISNFNNPGVLEAFGTIYKVDNLILEDILNVNQRPKFESFGHYNFITLKEPSLSKQNLIETNHISLIQGKDFVIFFSEKWTAVNDIVVERMNSRFEKYHDNVSKLAIEILDIIIDFYFPTIDEIHTIHSDLEERVLYRSYQGFVNQHLELRKQIMQMRGISSPLLEILIKLQRNENQLINEKQIPLLRDIYDHIHNILDQVEVAREMNLGLREVYMSNLSYKMNLVMKFLTIMSAFFLPATFITSLYGMNFANMPELNWSNGYIFSWTLIIFSTILVFLYFKIKKWL